ncbi:18568_t:CDS:2 [Funneliformis geosporum]|uniref:10293_t:CDS:1 n=1 Tax=Funneliformis geosporum TaxID=1117311 RepID=A0A9W4WVF6_9GLOM|nr:18568_t:CDS:2 [Funneliformis geosporum]CAI2166584.1 10293_t:CDS:2 [Funneliformis geosporum]
MKGTLKIVVAEARKLKDEDLIGKSDPYIKLILDKNNIQTTQTKKNDLNPVYNEQFIFNVDGQKKLEIQVWDKDTFGKDDLIGEDEIKLSEVCSKKYVDTWVKLTKGKLGFLSKGEVHLIMEFQ